MKLNDGNPKFLENNWHTYNGKDFVSYSNESNAILANSKEIREFRGKIEIIAQTMSFQEEK
jgi:hypothetical protein